MGQKVWIRIAPSLCTVNRFVVLSIWTRELIHHTGRDISFSRRAHRFHRANFSLYLCFCATSGDGKPKTGVGAILCQYFILKSSIYYFRFGYLSSTFPFFSSFFFFTFALCWRCGSHHHRRLYVFRFVPTRTVPQVSHDDFACIFCNDRLVEPRA